MKKLMFALAVAATYMAHSAIETYRLQRDTDTDTTMLVGADDVYRPIILVSPDEYTTLTGRFDLVWRQMNAKEDGRLMLHGRRVDTVIDQTNLVKTTYYNDGFVYTESIKRMHDMHTRFTNKVHRAVGRPAHVSQKMWEMIQARDAATKSVKEVFVEHDAATGKETAK